MKLAYMAHPVNGDGKPETRAANVARAKRWLKWLSRQHPDTFFVAQWIPLVEVLDDADEIERSRMLIGDEMVATKCDEFYLVGGALSNGMLRELTAFVGVRDFSAIRNLINLGTEPPDAE